MKKLYILLILFLGFLLWIGIEYALDEKVYLENIWHITIRDRHGEVLADTALPWGYSVPYVWKLDNTLIHSIISIEDRRYDDHWGFDIIGKASAIRESILAQDFVRGGSTITEQYIKNVYYPDTPRTLLQKIREGYRAIVISCISSKDEILRRYLNTVYMGNGIYGIYWAIELYFPGKTADTLSQSEIVEIITRIRNPNIGSSWYAYAERVSQRLYGSSFTWNLDRKIRKENINLFPHLTERIRHELSSYCMGWENHLSEFIAHPNMDICHTESIDITTTIDKDLSLFSMHTLEGIVGSLEEKNVHNSAVYILDPQKNTVLAYIGNRLDAKKENVIDMIQVRRSVGSVLKPFLYSIALADGADGESLILDDTKVYDTAWEKSFVPENYIPKSYGPTRLKEALGNSLNSATTRLAEKIGIGRVYDEYKKAWLSLDHDAWYYGYGIALWSVELTLENIVHGYTTLLDFTQGKYFLLYDILSNPENRSRTFGISSILNTSIPMAVKTGTSTDFYDNWTIWYHTDAIIGVWVGNADHTSMMDVSWVSGAGPIYHHIAEYMIQHNFIEPITPVIPDAVYEDYICLDASCMQKERAYLWKKSKHTSYIRDSIYSSSDFITPLTEDEMKKWKVRE